MAKRILMTTSAMVAAMCCFSAWAQSGAASGSNQKAVEPQVKSQSLYVGELPCADCQGIVYEVDLRDRGIFFQRVTYRGKAAQAPEYDFGKWSLDANYLTLNILGKRGKHDLYLVQDANTLRKLNDAGKPIESTLNYNLTRQRTYAPLEPVLSLQGVYSYRPEGETFTECQTGVTVPVAAEGRHDDLKAAYSVARKEPGKFVFVEMNGHIALRDGGGGNKRSTLVVDKMGKFFALRTCDSSGVTFELETTRWVPATLGSAPVIVEAGQREPFIVLQAQEHKISGFAGCNQFSGGYEKNGEQLKFSGTAATRMACEKGMDIEQRLLKSLEATQTWRIDGDRLQLRDKAGDVVANFKARNL